jgi:lysylphosphatidylglycerol synthetase-like protein (DUF2156 family)
VPLSGGFLELNMSLKQRLAGRTTQVVPVPNSDHTIEIYISSKILKGAALVVAGVAGLIMALDLNGSLQLSEHAWCAANIVFGLALWFPMQRSHPSEEQVDSCN